MSRRAINLKPEAEVAEVWKEDSSPPLNFTLHVDDLLEKAVFSKYQIQFHLLCWRKTKCLHGGKKVLKANLLLAATCFQHQRERRIKSGASLVLTKCKSGADYCCTAQDPM